MISKKIFTNADGNVTRFLSDFIVRSQDFARPYAYIYDNTLDPGGTEDKLQDGTTLQINWSWPDNIWKRGADLPQSSDIVTVDKWQVVDNSILFFIAPLTNTTLWLEIATTAEEFGETLTQPSVDKAEAAADAAELSETNAAASEAATAADVVSTTADVVSTTADRVQTGLDKVQTGLDVVSTNADVVLTGLDKVQTGLDVVSTNADVVLTGLDVVSSSTSATNAELSEWEAEAARRTSDSYATEAEDVFVNIWTSDGDGTYTSTPTTDYSALHWAAKSDAMASTYLPLDGSSPMTGELQANGGLQIGTGATLKTAPDLGVTYQSTTTVSWYTRDTGGVLKVQRQDGPGVKDIITAQLDSLLLDLTSTNITWGGSPILTTTNGSVLPTADPLVIGSFWNNGGIVTVSAG